jgi:Tfp pilus assembly protein PilX
MHRHTSQRGAALILLLGITATLAILSATLVFVIQNQQRATANERSGKQSFYAAEAALDSAVQVAKIDKTMSTTAEWLTPADLAAAFAGAFPPGAVVTYRVYDNLATVNYNIKWDQGGPAAANTPDQMVWVEATVTYQKKTTRARVLIKQSTEPFAAALPKAVTYSDTGIMLADHSDIYAVNADGTPDTSGSPYPTAISAGGTWIPSMSSGWAEVGRFTTNASSDLGAPAGGGVQSLGIKANGSVSLAGTVFNTAPTHSISGSGHTFTEVTIAPGTVGFLSDYFDQAAQASLADESQAGRTHAAAPAAPSSWTSSGFTAITSTLLSTLQSTTSTTAYVATSDLVLPTSLNSGNLTLSRGTNTTGRTFSFQDLYVAGNLTLTGPVTVTATSLYVGGTITINNTTTTTVTDSVGPLYVNGTGASSVAGRVNLTTTSARTGGALTISNSTTTALTDSLGALYAVGDLSISGNVTTSATSYLYAGGNATITGPSNLVTDQFGLIYTSGTTKTLTFSGNVQVKATSVVANGDFTISGASTAFTDWLGQVWVAAFSSSSNPSLNHGDVNWSGTASVTSRDYTQQAVPSAPAAQPKPLWLGRYWSRTGTYNDEYGNIWVPGNSSTSISLGSTGNSTIMCPLLCTTERTQVSGHINFGTRTQPMVYFFMCDNNGIYPQVVAWSCTGTFFGLMVINESTIDFTNGVTGTPSVEGAVFAGCPYDPTHTSGMSMSDIVLEDYSSIAYNQSVVGAIATSSLKTTTTVTQIVPGSWQQLSTH